MLELQCTESIVYSFQNTNAVFSATKQMKRMQAHGCWKLLSQWEKVAKCNFKSNASCTATDAEKLLSQWKKVSKCDFKSKAQVYERCFFLMKWNVICNAEDRFSWLELFCKASHIRASMHRITSLELLRTLMLCLCN